jgi:short-subunit dehydrogenase
MYPWTSKNEELTVIRTHIDSLEAQNKRAQAELSKGTVAELRAQAAPGLTVLLARAGELEREFPFGVVRQLFESVIADPAERDRLTSEIERRGLAVEVLVNNAGFGIYVPFVRSDRDRELQQIRLQVEAVVDLNARYVPSMVGRRRGAVNISSTAGFQPLPGNGTYAACKSFVLFHSEALAEEVRDSGVTVTAVCPGPVHTEFQEVSEPLFADKLPKAVWVGPERVAEDGLRAVERGKRTVIPGGAKVRLAFGPNRVAPARVALPISRRVMARELERGDARE